VAQLTEPADPPESAALLRIDGLSVTYRRRRRMGFGGRQVVRAVRDFSLTVAPDEVVGLVGESGCGKTTVGMATMRLAEWAGGAVTLDSTALGSLSGSELRRVRRQLQMVFQDPRAVLDPRVRIGRAVVEPAVVHHLVGRAERDELAIKLLSAVGLPAEAADRFPDELSGGQLQRVAIARALSCQPKVLICDEILSALDVSLQAQILNLLAEIRRDLGLAMVFISHDLATVRRFCDRTVVMYLGEIVEVAESEVVSGRPLHPYTVGLMSSVLSPTPRGEMTVERLVLAGELPSPANPPAGCTFHTRCPMATELCGSERPRLTDAGDGHLVRCHYWQDTGTQLQAYLPQARAGSDRRATRWTHRGDQDVAPAGGGPGTTIPVAEGAAGAEEAVGTAADGAAGSVREPDDAVVAGGSSTAAADRRVFSRRTWARMSRSSRVSAAILAVVLIGMVVGSIWTADPYLQDLQHVSSAPSWLGGAPGHPLGTDDLGRDILARLLVATRTSIIICAAATVIGAVLGVVLGLLAGYFGGVAETVIMRLVDLQMSLPGIVLILVALAIFKPSSLTTVIVLALASWMIFARLTRAEVLMLRDGGLLRALRAMGAPTARTLLRHVLPNTFGPSLVVATVTLGSQITALAALSYLGFGVPPPTPTLGGMIADGQTGLTSGIWWTVGWPALVIVVLVLCTNSLGDNVINAFRSRRQSGE
jgi:oligopeptide/dipeptide ABC transporter ATP-binding protein